MEHQTRQTLVAELLSLLAGGNAHVTFEDACADLTPALWNQYVPAAPHTIWQLVEHVRIAQADILAFCLDAGYESPEWPAGYWPAPAAPADETAWQAALTHIARDQERLMALLQDPATDLLTPLPHGTGQTILREALLVADHAAYHTGQIVLLRRQLGAWE